MKSKRIKASKYESNDTKEIKSLIIITLVVILIAASLYFLTIFVNNKKGQSSTNVDYDTCLVGNMFNRPYDEYYVFLYSSLDSNASTYRGLITNYNEKEDSKKIYYVDLNDKFNKEYLSDSSNPNPSSVSEVKIKDSALVLIKDGKVAKYMENLDDYKNTLE